MHETRLLGLIINDQLSWHSNTTFIVKKAFKRMSILNKMFEFTVPLNDLVDIYIVYIRLVIESSAVVWSSSLTQGQVLELERVQKIAMRIILKEEYIEYDNTLHLCSLQNLGDRRN